MKKILALLSLSVVLLACTNEGTNAVEIDAEQTIAPSVETAVQNTEEESVVDDIDEGTDIEKEVDIPQGNFQYEIFQAEYG